MNIGGFSWRRLLGISGFKAQIARKTGIPFTKTGRQRKVGAALGPLVPIAILLMAGARLFRSKKHR
jgi:hypothetical protein